MFLEDSLEEEREQESYYSDTHKDQNAERYDLLVIPGKANACGNNGEKDRGGKIGDRQEQGILDRLLDGLIKPSDKRESIGRGREDREKEKERRIHGPGVLCREHGPYEIDFEGEKGSEYAINDPETRGFQEVLFVASEEIPENRRILAGNYLNSNLI